MKRERDRRREHGFSIEPSELRERQIEPRDAPRHGCRFGAHGAIADHLVEERLRGGTRGFLAKIHGDRGSAVRAIEKKAAATEVAGARVRHGERVRRGDDGVRGVATRFEHGDARTRRVLFHRDDHPVAAARDAVAPDRELGTCGGDRRDGRRRVLWRVARYGAGTRCDQLSGQRGGMARGRRRVSTRESDRCPKEPERCS